MVIVRDYAVLKQERGVEQCHMHNLKKLRRHFLNVPFWKTKILLKEFSRYGLIVSCNGYDQIKKEELT